jgi:hypothetical protein
VAAAQTARAPKDLPESPFANTDPVIKDSFARANAAYDIGNYSKSHRTSAAWLNITLAPVYELFQTCFGVN